MLREYVIPCDQKAGDRERLMPSEARLISKEKQSRYRSRLREKGLRPVQIWVPDTRAAGFATECRRQARLAARSAQERPVLDFISAIADWDNG